MQTETWLLYLFAIVLIGISPGPIAMLSMSHGIHFGKKRSIATGLGSISAALVLMVASAAGLGTLISASNTALPYSSGVVAPIWCFWVSNYCSQNSTFSHWKWQKKKEMVSLNNSLNRHF